jgi:MFS family permease
MMTASRSGPLGVPAFRLLTFGQFASTIGDYCYAVALPWLVLSGGGSAASLGIVLACYGIPRAVMTVPGGSLADRFGARLLGSAAALWPTGISAPSVPACPPAAPLPSRPDPAETSPAAARLGWCCDDCS